jgi:pimeloyl-ACP methyl ester carboxylesterase
MILRTIIARLRAGPAAFATVALLVVITALLLTAAGNASGATTNGHAQRGPARDGKPTIVFIHGGWADSSGWNDQVMALRHRGFAVIAPANPLRSLTSDSEYVSSVLSTIEGPIVMVGHSYGGAVITNASVGHPNVKALVYIAGFAPDQGETLGHLVSKNPGTLIGPKTLTNRPYPLPGGGQGIDTYIKASAFRRAFAGDLPKRTTDAMAAVQRPFAASVFDEPSGAPAWKSVRSWYLVTTRDHAIPPATQRFMAERARAHVTEVKSSHVPMISRPRSVTTMVLDAARSKQR